MLLILRFASNILLDDKCKDLPHLAVVPEAVKFWLLSHSLGYGASQHLSVMFYSMWSEIYPDVQDLFVFYHLKYNTVQSQAATKCNHEINKINESGKHFIDNI